MEHNININQGATFKMLLTIKDPEDSPIDLTGYEFKGQIRNTYADKNIQAEFVFTLQPQTGGTLGQVMCEIPAEGTAAIKYPAGCSGKTATMVYDIESLNGAEVVRWLQGNAIISPEVTR